MTDELRGAVPVAFVVPRAGQQDTPELRRELAQAIVEGWASTPRPPPCTSCRLCRAPAVAKSCGGSCVTCWKPDRSKETPAAWKTPTRSISSGSTFKTTRAVVRIASGRPKKASVLLANTLNSLQSEDKKNGTPSLPPHR
nr:hypothetical protein [Deinococcus cavernae]